MHPAGWPSRFWHWLTDPEVLPQPNKDEAQGWHWDEQARHDLDVLLETEARRRDPRRRRSEPSGMAWETDEDD